MKKGFTLIELLAVIVILAIIALIAVPIVLNIINDSKESSLLRSAEFYLDAAEYAIADAYLYHGGLESRDYPITPEGDICTKPLPCDDEHTLKVEVNGDKPTGGFVTIDSGKISNVKLILDEKTISKNSKGELIYYEIPCVLAVDDNSNSQIDIGDKITCKTESFYVVNNDGINIEMLTEKNINVTGVGEVKQMDNAGTILFASSQYWQENNTLLDKYMEQLENISVPGETFLFVQTFYLYDENSKAYPYIIKYKEHLLNSIKLLNVLDIKLLSCTQFTSLANYLPTDPNTGAGGYYTGPTWLMGTNGEYFLGTAYYFEDPLLYSVTASTLRGHNDSPDQPHITNAGVRPVVTISKEEIKIN